MLLVLNSLSWSLKQYRVKWNSIAFKNHVHCHGLGHGNSRRLGDCQSDTVLPRCALNIVNLKFEYTILCLFWEELVIGRQGSLWQHTSSWSHHRSCYRAWTPGLSTQVEEGTVPCRARGLQLDLGWSLLWGRIPLMLWKWPLPKRHGRGDISS